MRAWAIKKYNANLEIVNVAEPTVGNRDVLINIHAAGLNHLDEMLRNGDFKALIKRAMPLILGNELAGVVSEVGSAVTEFSVGDQVFAKPSVLRAGTFAERIAVDASEVALKPQKLSMQEAGSFALVGLTAWQALIEEGQLQAGQSVLIHGGSGGVGSAAIQIAKLAGAFVATTASASNADYVRSLGADLVIDYKSQDFSSMLSDYDLVLDHLGGDNLLKSIAVLKPGGKAIGIAGPPDPDFVRSLKGSIVLEFLISLISAKVRKAAKRQGVKYKFLFVKASGSQLAHLAALIDSDKIRPLATKACGFDETATALSALSSNKYGGGKLVIVNDLN